MKPWWEQRTLFWVLGSVLTREMPRNLPRKPAFQFYKEPQDKEPQVPCANLLTYHATSLRSAAYKLLLEPDMDPFHTWTYSG